VSTRLIRPAGLSRLVLAVVPPLIFSLIFSLVGFLVLRGRVEGALVGTVAWMVVRLGPVRMLLLGAHARGMAASRDGDWEGALGNFRRSEASWQRLAWLDRWRAPLLGSGGRWPYALLARYNQALCLLQLGRTDEAQALAQALVQEAPGMQPARTLLGALEGSRAPDRSPPTAPPRPGGEEGWFS